MEGWWAASYVVLWALVITLAVVVVALARQIGTLHLRLGPRGALEMDDEGPPLHEAPPPHDAADLDGRPVTIGGPGETQVLLFVSPGCRICEEVLPGVGALATDVATYVITDAERQEARRALAPKNLPCPIVAAPELARTYAIPGTPYVVFLDELGVVRAKGTVNNLEQMEGLVDTARRRVAGEMTERQAS